MLFDAYHAVAMGLSLKSEISSFGDLIGHAQYASAPGRLGPARGRTDPWEYAALLADFGYAGPIGLEFTVENTTKPRSTS